MHIDSTEKNNKQKLGLLALTSIVVSSMIGSGVDGLPQNMAENSAVGPVAIAWIVCGIGMFFISRTFIVLSNIRPDLQSGVYMYAREGFGRFTAFNVAWGYWLMTIFSNVAFAIMVMDTLNYFLPGDFKGGNNIPSVIGASLLIWGFNFLVLSGTRIAGSINIVGTLAKLIPLVAFIIILMLFMKYTTFADNVWGHSASKASQDLGSIFSQVTSPLSVALWSFIGVEGAVALSGRAKNKRDVGKATFIGFVVSLIICLLVSILPFGVLTQHENGTFPKPFSKKNVKGSASVSLYISSAFMQIVVLLVYFSNDAWLAMLAISTLTVLPAYLMTTAYLFKLCISGEYASYTTNHSRSAALVSSIIGFVFCLFMFYASEIKYLAMVPVLLTLGVPLFIWARKKDDRADKIFTLRELAFFILLLVLDIIVFILLHYKTIHF